MEGSEWALRAAVRLRSQPDKVLTGLVVPQQEVFRTGQQADVELVLVLDDAGNELYRERPTEFADWRPEHQSTNNST